MQLLVRIRNVSLIRIALETKLVTDRNAEILALVLAVLMPSVKLSTTRRSVSVHLVITALLKLYVEDKLSKNVSFFFKSRKM